LRLCFYVSGHGFGHATRTRALLAALRARGGPALALHVRSEAPAWLFRDRVAGVEVSRAPIDPGVIQSSGLDLDLAATLAAHEAFLAGWDGAVAREAAFLEALRPDVVVSDVAPLAFAAAARVGAPGVGVANFGWDWILEPWAAREPRFEPPRARYAEAYATALRLFRLPLHGDFPAFRDVVDAPFLVNRSARTRAECRAALAVPAGDGRPLVLVSSGGFGSGPIDARDADSADGFRFVGVGEKPAGLRADWHALPSPSRLAHEDLMRACDAVVGKTGYSTIAEAAAHGTRFLYPPREGFRECEVHEREIGRHCAARPIARADFAAGRWRAPLEALFALPPVRSDASFDGAERIAEALLAMAKK